MNFDYAMRETLRTALHSEDPSTQNAAMLLSNDGSPLCVAENNFPECVTSTEQRWQRPAKYDFVEHAERAVIYKAAFDGIQTFGTTMVCPWAACADCARALIGAGVSTLVRFPITGAGTHNQWAESVAIGDQMLNEANVTILEYASPLPLVEPVMRNGKQWLPPT